MSQSEEARAQQHAAEGSRLLAGAGREHQSGATGPAVLRDACVEVADGVVGWILGGEGWSIGYGKHDALAFLWRGLDDGGPVCSMEVQERWFPLSRNGEMGVVNDAYARALTRWSTKPFGR